MTEKMKVYISRREFLKLASLGALGTALAACGPRITLTPEDTGSEPQPTDELAPANPDAVQWWVGWGELVPIFASFKEMAKYKELLGSTDVEMKPSVANEALFTALAAGSPPDAASQRAVPRPVHPRRLR
ncbi:MAG: twin-arginine translocation signal domain-containing protein [Anaerolineae bacterium]|nr:twin-arginine translocation signal domain-containing protein [Anaerolineae bacterium]